MIRELCGFDPHSIDDTGPYITRILSLYESYGEEYDFVRLFVQERGGEVTSAVSLFEGRASLWLTEKSDLEEMAAFLRFQPCSSVMADVRFPLDFPCSYEISGDVLSYERPLSLDTSDIIEPDAEELYMLLKRCEEKTFVVPDYLFFLSDVTHRKNRGKCRMIGVRTDGVLSSCAMTVSDAESAVILGAVATHPDFRFRGLSRRVVTALANDCLAMKKRVFVFSAKEENTRFYERSGFDVVSRFCEKIR